MTYLLPVASQFLVFAGSLRHLVEMAFQGRIEYSPDERRLAGAAHSSHHGEHVQRKSHVDAFQIVHPCALHHDAHVPRSSAAGHL